MKNYALLFLLSFFILKFDIISAQIIQMENEDNEELKSAKCGGVERWSVKVLTDDSASQVNYSPKLTTLDSLVHVVTPTPNSSAPRIPGLEFQNYKIRCHITIKKSESDNDYHVVVSDGTYTMITESADPVCSEAASSSQVAAYIKVRQWLDSYIPGDNYSVNLPDVAITGVLFLDPPHGQTGVSLNNTEIHPILNIGFWNPTGTNNILPSPILTVDISPDIFSSTTHLKLKSQISNLGNCKFEFYSSAGEKVKEFELPVLNNNEIDYIIQRSNLTSGLYIYRILNNDKLLYGGKLEIE